VFVRVCGIPIGGGNVNGMVIKENSMRFFKKLKLEQP
jgi:hypothetical protein